MVALTESVADRPERALDALEQAVDAKASQLFAINAAPLLEPLRAEPRFQALLERMNLAE